MVLVWDLTIAIMNGSEREGRARERERQKGATGSSLHTTLSFFSFFFLMSRFIKPFVFNLFT